MRLTYDPDADAGYLMLSSPGEPRTVAKTYLCDPIEVGGQIHLDFDAEGKLIGIEILGLSHKLRASSFRAFAEGAGRPTG